MMAKDYTIGLDIGTNSVGWAVIDDEFELVKKKRKVSTFQNGKIIETKNNRTNFWGVRLFEEGDVAADTRLKRGTRRRLKRRHERLRYLQSMFALEMSKVDPNFFYRLDESFLWLSDKKIEQTKYSLFRNKEEEQSYYDKFPTIYHLRDFVMTHEVDDLRLVYLAIHHIIKFRGNFLYQDKEDFNVENIDIKASLRALFEILNDTENELAFEFDLDLLDDAQNILKNKQWSKSKKAFELKNLFSHSDSIKQKQLTELFKLIVGNKGSFSNLFAKDDYKEIEQKDIKLSDASASEKFEKAVVENGFTEVEIEILDKLNAIYEAVILSNILSKSTLSKSMIEKYESHATDLKILKSFFVKNFKNEAYNEIFKDNIDGNYASYVKGFDKGNKRDFATQEKFYTFIVKKLISKINSDYQQNLKDNGNGFLEKAKNYIKENIDLLNSASFEVKYKDDADRNFTMKTGDFYIDIFNKIETETFLMKQREFRNGAIPFQIHMKELVRIIKRQKYSFTFLSEMVEIGEIDNRHKELKLESLMKFRIPYYVGPLTPANNGEIGKKSSDKSRFSWMQSSGEKITPWNFDLVVDKDASAFEFIQRMTNFDSYLPEEKVLPKNSLLYQEFTVYNELAISGYYDEQNKKNYFDGVTRQKIVQELFQKDKNVTQEKMRDWLYNNEYTSNESPKLFGIDTGVKSPKFNAKLSTYIDLSKIVPSRLIDENLAFFDQIVEFQTVFEDNKVLKRQIARLNTEYDDVLNDEQIKKLAKKHYTGWGRLSRNLLDGLHDKGKTIMGYLRTADYNQNFMSLIEDDSKVFKSEIDKAQNDNINADDFSYDNLVSPIVGSPAIKRAIWQSLKIVKEISEIMGYDPRRIVVEMARDNQNSRRSKPRLQQLKEKRETFVNELVRLDETQNLDSERVFLYYLQNGKDMYTGESLSLNDLKSYEVDHIIPQTYVKDDSIDNKVLVKRTSNQIKGGDIPSAAVIANMKNYWQILFDAQMISRKKFINLTKENFSKRDIEGFINRQLVQTQQITKNIAQILSNYFKDNTDILTPKASLTSQFRKGIVYLNKEELSEPDLQFHMENGGEVIEGKYIEVKLHEGFYKVREINDYHHAHDAYLNAVVANYLYRTFSDEKGKILIYGKHLNREERNALGKYATTRKGKFKQFLTPMIEEKWLNLDTGEIIWDRDDALKTINKVMSYKQINIVKKTEEQKGEFSKQERLKKGKASFSFKKGWSVDQYGGLSSETSAFAVPISYEKGKNKKKLVRELISVTIREKTEFEKNAQQFVESKLNPVIVTNFGEIIRKNNAENIKVLSKPLKKYQLYEFEDGRRRMVASAKEAQKGNQFFYSREYSEFLYHANHYDEIKYKASFEFVNKNQDTFKDILIYILEIAENYSLANQKIIKKLKETIEDTAKYSVQELAKATIGFVNILSAGTTNLGNTLKDINGPVGEGARIRYTSASDTDVFNATLIHQSVTGLYETRVKLK